MFLFLWPSLSASPQNLSLSWTLCIFHNQHFIFLLPIYVGVALTQLFWIFKMYLYVIIFYLLFTFSTRLLRSQIHYNCFVVFCRITTCLYKVLIFLIRYFDNLFFVDYCLGYCYFPRVKHISRMPQRTCVVWPVQTGRAPLRSPQNECPACRTHALWGCCVSALLQRGRARWFPPAAWELHYCFTSLPALGVAASGLFTELFTVV